MGAHIHPAFAAQTAQASVVVIDTISRACLPAFEYWIEAARQELHELAKYQFPSTRRMVLEQAAAYMRHALRAANKAGCRARKSLCLRVLNWIRADLRRAAC